MEIEVAEGYILVRAEALLAVRDIDEAIERLERNPLVSPAIPILLDLRKVSELKLDAEVTRQYARGLEQMNRLRLAVVAADDLTFGMARLFQSELRSAKVECKVFQDFYLALSWLRQQR